MLGLKVSDRPTGLPSYKPFGGPMKDREDIGHLRPGELRYQYRTSACVGFAGATAIGILATQFLANPSRVPQFSAFWNYWFARDEWGITNKDEGSFVEDGIRVMEKFGAVDVRWMDDDTHPLEAPPRVPEEERFRITDHREIRLWNASDRAHAAEAICDCISNGLPVIIGIATAHAVNSSTQRTGRFTVPANLSGIHPDHAVCIVGFFFDQGKLWFRFENSWGTRWGDHGYGYFPAEYLLHSALSLSAQTFSFDYQF